MYQDFKIDFLSALSDLDQETMSRISFALDAVSVNYTINKAETSLTVVGQEEFQQIAAAYLITRRTEGLSSSYIANVGRDLNNFIIGVGKPIDKVTNNDIRAYLFRYQEINKVTNRTLDGMRSKLCTFFKWCAAEKYIQTDITANIKPIKYIEVPRKALTQLELENVRRACHTDREKCIIEVLYSTGCRISELCNMRIDDIDMLNHEVMVLGKGGKYRKVFLNAKALISIDSYLTNRSHTSQYLICNDRGGGKLTRSNAEKIFRRIEHETGIRVTPHIMRHTMATQALTGTGVEVVQKMLGHSNIATTMIYAEVDQNSVHAAHNRVVI